MTLNDATTIARNIAVQTNHYSHVYLIEMRVKVAGEWFPSGYDVLLSVKAEQDCDDYNVIERYEIGTGKPMNLCIGA